MATSSPMHLRLTRDGRLLFGTRIARMFAYGFLSVVLLLYLSQAGLRDTQIGLLLTLTLAGDTAISLWITMNADRFGRRRMLVAGAALMLFAGILFALTRNFYLLLIAATVGVLSPSGGEVGPFLAIEQASLAQIVPGERRTRTFAWYNLLGSFATALGALCGGGLAQALQGYGATPLGSYRAVVAGYAVLGVVLGLLFSRASPAIEPCSPDVQTAEKRFGLHRSRKAVFRLAGLFSLDGFAGGFMAQSIMAYWLHAKFGVQPGVLGAIFFATNVLAGISALTAVWIASRIGLIRTMVFTHIPAAVLLMLIPLMPSLPIVILLLLLRANLSNMDVPTRQSYIMAVVDPDERSAAAGVTGIARTTGMSLAPLVTGHVLASTALTGLTFVGAGVLKIAYDLMLYRSFRSLKPPEEERGEEPGRAGHASI